MTRLQARILFRILTSPSRGKKAPDAALGTQAHESSKRGEKQRLSCRAFCRIFAKLRINWDAGNNCEIPG